MSPLFRRSLMAAIPAAAVAPALPVIAANPDADLIRLCAEHVVNLNAYNAHGGILECEDDPLWHAYERTRNAVSEAEPKTVAGMLAKARAAKVEALMPDGREMVNGSMASPWAWDLLNDLLRLNGGAA